MSGATVVTKRARLPRAELHALLMAGWSRGAVAHKGAGGWADAIGCTRQAHDKHLTGSMPSFETINEAFDAEPTVLDDWVSAKGKRIVEEDAVCDSDDLSLLLSRVLVMIQEAEHPDGPGGRAIVPQEYLAGETLMRELHAATARWLERCGDIRRPRAA